MLGSCPGETHRITDSHGWAQALPLLRWLREALQRSRGVAGGLLVDRTIKLSSLLRLYIHISNYARAHTTPAPGSLRGSAALRMERCVLSHPRLVCGLCCLCCSGGEDGNPLVSSFLHRAASQVGRAQFICPQRCRRPRARRLGPPRSARRLNRTCAVSTVCSARRGSAAND